MANTKEGFKKEKVTALCTAISTGVLCLQHFWGMFAPEGTVQVAYIPLIVTFVVLIASEEEGNYKDKKWIIFVSAIGIAILAIVGLSISTINDYGITEFEILKYKIEVNINSVTKVTYGIIALITFVLTLLGMKKWVEI